MALIDFYIRNQKLSKNGPDIVADSVKYVDCSFTFKTSDWNGLDKWAIFQKGEEVYRADLVDDSIPKETGLNLGEGIWHVSLFGAGADGTRITTDSVTIEVKRSSVSDGEPLPVIEQTEAEQIAAKAQSAFDIANEAAETANAVKEAAEKGEFNGKDGEQGPQGIPGKDYVLTEYDKEEIAGKIKPEDIGALPLSGGKVTGETEFTKDVTFWNSIHDTLQMKAYTGIGGEELITLYPAAESGYPEVVTHGTIKGKFLPVKFVVGDPEREDHAATKKYVDEGLAEKIGQGDLETATNEVLAKAKASGEFDGAPGADGKDYVLTEEDKKEIAGMIEITGGEEKSDYETVDSIEEMTDTNKSYILKSTGTLWSWLPTETEVEVDKTEQIVSTADNPAKDGYSLSTSGDSVNATHVITPYIDLHKYGFPCTLNLNGLTWITETYDEGIAIGKLRVQTYNESQEYILQYSSAKTGTSLWPWATNHATVIDSTHQKVEFPEAYYINSSKTVRYLRFCTKGAWANADISVTYKGTETVIGDPAWQDTGIVVADITDFPMVNPDVKSYVDNVSYDDDNTNYSKSSVSTYAAYDYYRKDLPVPAVLRWDEDNMASEYVVAISTVAGISKSSCVKYYTDTNRILIHNLVPNTLYYYKVHAMCVNSTKKLVKEGSFTTGTHRTRMLNVDGIQNVRDIGGYSGLNGAGVKYGMIYRGSALDEDHARTLCITDKGIQEMTAHIGIRTDLDLRYGATGSSLGVGIDFINTSTGFENYANVFKVPIQRTNFKNLFESAITQLNASKPIYIHCQGGCDRTGTLVFLFLGLLGVSETDLAKEYELSSFSTIGFTRERNGEKYKGMITQLKENYSGTSILEKLVDFATKANDDTETGGCGIDSSKIDTFRNLMLVGGATVVKYGVTNNLTNCANSNAATEVDSGASYSGTISANDGYELSTVTVTMGGTDITSTVYKNGTVTIPNVTGNVVITAAAVEAAKYTNLFNTSGSGFDDQSTKFYTNWIPYNSADNDGNGTIYHFKGFASSTTPYKVNFATDANGTGATSQIYGNALNRQNRTAASYNSKVNIIQHYIEGYSFIRFECREAVPSNFIITANEEIID